MFGLQLTLLLSTLAIHSEYNNPPLPIILKTSAVTFGIIIIIIAIRYMAKLKTINTLKQKIDIKLTIKIILSMVVSLVIATQIFEFFNIQAQEQSNQSSIDTLILNFPAVIFIIIIVAPIIEELIFRQLIPMMLNNALSKSISPINKSISNKIWYLSFILPSLIFILLHSPSGIIGITSYSIMTIAFLFSRLRKNNLITAIIVHIVWNSFSVLGTLIG